MGTCTYNDDNSITFKGNKDYTLDDAIDPQQNKKAGGLYGETGGFQPVQGEWNLHFTRIPYSIGSISDMAVESFAGTHDLLGGQAWGWYDKQGNTAEKNKTYWCSIRCNNCYCNTGIRTICFIRCNVIRYV